MERLNEEAKQAEGKSGKREVLENKKVCLEHLPCQVFGERFSGVGISFRSHLWDGFFGFGMRTC